jgi:hypothetical protein
MILRLYVINQPTTPKHEDSNAIFPASERARSGESGGARRGKQKQESSTVLKLAEHRKN